MLKNKTSFIKKLIPISLSVIAVLLDQISKILVIKNIPVLTIFSDDSAIIPIFGNVLRLIHVKNPAVAFSMGASLPDNVRHILFSIIPLVVIILVYVIYFRNNDFTQLQRWSICGILGGGIGNLIDRFFRPDGVIDFIDFIWFGWKKSPVSFLSWDRWPTFNIADSFVVVCGILFVLSFIKVSHDEKKGVK